MVESPFKPRMTRILIACGVCFVVGYLFHGCVRKLDSRCVDGGTEVHLDNGDGSSSWYDTGQKCACGFPSMSPDNCSFGLESVPVYSGKG